MTGLSKNLLSWFEQNARVLPWREKRTPYRVWLSEIMLQQTRVETVLPYYQRFLARFPMLEDLAQAPLDEVYQLWEGLGYYSRARNLHRAAQSVVRDYNGNFPQTLEELQKLPGIGAYTAGAVASLAFGMAVPAVDGNVIRVFARLAATKMDPSLPKTRLALEQKISKLIPQEKAGAFNEALMELGATVCTPRNPLCTICPLQKDCRGFASGKPDQFPGKPKAIKIRREEVALTIITHRQKVLLKKSPEKGLLGGLWGFPVFSIPKKQKKLTSWVLTQARKDLSLSLTVDQTLPSFLHRFTHIEMRHHPFFCSIKQPKRPQKNYAWVAINQLDQYPLPKAHRKIALNLTKHD